MNTCEFLVPVEGDASRQRPCGEPSVWMTDDCRDVHYLCGEHCGDALREGVAMLLEPPQRSL